jgi:hypothetical protein
MVKMQAMRNVTLFGAHTPNIASYGELTERNKREYCAAMGYGIAYRTEKVDNRPAAWTKIVMMMEADFDLGIWVDADAWIVDKSFDVRDIVDNRHEFYIAKRDGNLNMGVFLCNGSDYVKDVLFEVNMMSEFYDHEWWEQAAFIDLYKRDMELRSKTMILDADFINGDPENDEPHFIIHVPGTCEQGRINLFKSLSNG